MIGQLNHPSRDAAHFSSSNSLDSLSFLPSAPPPASAPPPPPPGLQHPVITNYGTYHEGDDSSQNEPLLFNGVNTGRQNTQINIPKTLFRLRLLNILCATLALLFEIPTFIFKLFTPNRMALALYLAVLSSILCAFEMHVPAIAQFLRDQFGFIYHPTGRAVLLFLMGGLAIGQATIFEFVIGVVMVGNGVMTLILACKYDEFEDVYQEEGRNMRIGENVVDKAYAWANPL